MPDFRAAVGEGPQEKIERSSGAGDCGWHWRDGGRNRRMGGVRLSIERMG